LPKKRGTSTGSTKSSAGIKNDRREELSINSLDNKRLNKRPNFLLIMVDEERYPPVYESTELKTWREQNLLAQEYLRSNGLEFQRHYAASVACSPSRASLFTGHYPSLHRVTQTSGPGKGPFGDGIFWLDPNTVPTIGDYFEAAGYQTFYKGKWHISHPDILIPGTYQSFPSYDPQTGVPGPQRVDIYLNADRLANYGFHGWVGPEPHGSSPHDSGSSSAIGLAGRDQVFAAETIELIERLDQEQREHPSAEPKPWFIVSSFVNPHDITLFGEITRQLPQFNFEVDPTIPDIPPPPTWTESLSTKPRAQRSYRDLYPRVFQPTGNSNFYRQLYFQLQKNVDQQIGKVLESLRGSSFYEDTIVTFSSDHGEMLGAHGGMHQKWYNAYEETIHVPLLMHNPKLFNGRKTTDILTSHVDLLPTMLGLAGIDADVVQQSLKNDHTEVHPLVGRDLSPLILGEGKPDRAGEPLYFMTDDDPTTNTVKHGLLGIPYEPVVQPKHIETVIAELHTNGRSEIWKYSVYFDNPQFWSNPGIQDEQTQQAPALLKDGTFRQIHQSICFTTVKTEPVPNQYELYNVTADPLEVTNLAFPSNATDESREIQRRMSVLLKEQRQKKRLSPSSGNV